MQEVAASQLRFEQLHFIEAVLDKLPAEVAVFDAEHRYLYCNPAAAGDDEIRAWIIGKNDFEYCAYRGLDRSLAERRREQFAMALQRRSLVSWEEQIPTAEGSVSYHLKHLLPVYDDEGVLQYVIGYGLDISDLKRTQNALRLSEANLQAIFEHSQDAFMLIDRDFKIRGFNQVAAQRACRVFGKEMAIGVPTLEFVHPEDRELFDRVIQDAFAGKPTRFERNIRTEEGDDYWAEIHYNPVLNEQEIVGAAFISRDITERKRYEDHMQHMAYYDSLTGLPNRRLLQERSEELLRSAEQTGSPLALLYLDLNRFKHVNDTLGHDAGDELLALVTRELQGCLRPGETLARLGGDEFAFVLPGTDGPRLDGVLGRILAAVKKPYGLKGRTAYVDGSIGVACYPEHGQSLEELLKHADMAMYQAKGSGSGYAVYSPGTKSTSVQKLELEHELRLAVEGAQLLFHYQPLLNLRNGRVEDCEALVRWSKGDSLIPANVFISLAEETELIRQIDWLALEGAASQASRWHQAGHPMRVSINLSGRSLCYEQLIPYVHSLLEQGQLPADRLLVEVTENAAMSNPEAALGALQQLKELGLRIVVDNFGSGYASLTYLRRLPADQVKIDRDLIKGIGESSQDEDLIAAAISLGHNLGLEVVAGGIETAAQLRWLTDQGCDFAQGYLIGRPGPASSI